jgi:hypothetical protein
MILEKRRFSPMNPARPFMHSSFMCLGGGGRGHPYPYPHDLKIGTLPPNCAIKMDHPRPPPGGPHPQKRGQPPPLKIDPTPPAMGARVTKSARNPWHWDFISSAFGWHWSLFSSLWNWAPHIMLRDLLTEKCSQKKVTDFGYPTEHVDSENWK